MTIKQQHAVGWYVTEKGYKLHALQTYPTYSFFEPGKDVTHVVHIDEISHEYETYLRLKEKQRKAKQGWKI